MQGGRVFGVKKKRRVLKKRVPRGGRQESPGRRKRDCKKKPRLKFYGEGDTAQKLKKKLSLTIHKSDSCKQGEKPREKGKKGL